MSHYPDPDLLDNNIQEPRYVFFAFPFSAIWCSTCGSDDVFRSTDDHQPTVRIDLSVNQKDDAPSESPALDENAPLLFRNNRTVKVEKDIGFFESLVYMFVQNYGFAILSVPIVFQQGSSPLLPFSSRL